jgi:hypothetical protein
MEIFASLTRVLNFRAVEVFGIDIGIGIGIGIGISAISYALNGK